MSDPILFWNDVALEANRVAHTNGKNEQTGPVLSARALAIVHLAAYDAFAATAPKPTGPNPVILTPYLPNLPTPVTGASPAAAVAAAAHATLSSLYPSQKAFFDAKHAQAPLSGNGLQTGHSFGLTVASRILELRKSDPGNSDDGYAASVARGAHRQDPNNPGQGFLAPFYGANSRNFAVTARHGLSAPPQPNTKPYQAALKQVREKGIEPELTATLPAGSKPRTPTETLIGQYWGYDGAIDLGTPPRLYNQIIRAVAIAQDNSVAENARLFALINAAMADAGILAWEQKYKWNLWRPVLAIREGDLSLGPVASPGRDLADGADPNWLPLGAPKTNSPTMEKNFTPNFPAYPSGHASFGAAALHITRLFYRVKDFKDDALFAKLSFVSDEFNGVNKDNKGAVRPKHARSFPGGLWQMIVENGLSRVFLGVHWEFDAFMRDANGVPDLTQNIGGIPLGITVADDIFKNGLTLSKVGPGTKPTEPSRPPFLPKPADPKPSNPAQQLPVGAKPAAAAASAVAADAITNNAAAVTAPATGDAAADVK